MSVTRLPLADVSSTAISEPEQGSPLVELQATAVIEVTGNVPFRSTSSLVSEARPLLRFENVTFRGGGERPILSDITFDVYRGERVFIFGARGSGKSSLVKLITGAIVPSGGEIGRHGRISFALGELPFFSHKAPIVEYVRFLAKSYGASPDEVWAFFESLAIAAYQPDRTLGELVAKDRRTLSVLVGLLIPFDIYILDDYSPFLTVSEELAYVFEERARVATFVFSTRMAAIAKQHATRIGVISGGKVSFFDTFSDGVRALRATPGGPATP